jgi:HD-GYP domain-containing protein (c-di-GMP phosphodiesterase class II)
MLGPKRMSPMSPLILQYPVHTQDSQMLLPAGTVLSEETLEALISSNRTLSHPTYSLMDYGSVRQDLLDFLSTPHYEIIFADQKRTANVLNLMESVSLVLPVLRSLNYFKEKDFHTYRHNLIVFALSTLLAKHLIPNHEQIVQDTMAGPTHDIGKICIPLHILRKVEPLTREENRIVRHHALAGYVLLSYYLRDRRNITTRLARDHHERRDGSGYPRGIQQMNLMVEIVAVSDVYDALIASRPYRPVSYDNRTALEEITSMAKRKELSWGVTRALIALNRKNKPHYSELTISGERRGTPPPGNVYGIVAEDSSSSSTNDK